MSYTDFKEVVNIDGGDSTHYGSDQLKEVMQIFNNKTVTSRRVRVKNAWQFTDHIEMVTAAATPTAPTDNTYVNLFMDPADNHLKLQQFGGSLTDLQVFSLDTNTLAYTTANNFQGDLLKNNSTKYVRMGRGSTGQVLVSTASDIQWAMLDNSSISATAAIAWTKISKSGSKLIDMADAAMTPANGQVPTWNSSTSQWVAQTPPGSSVGESNTASNQGVGGVGLFNAKVGVDLQFKNINAASTKITVTNDTVNKEVDIDVNQANLSLSSIGGAVTDSQTPTSPSGKTYNIDTNTLKHSTTNAEGDLLSYDVAATKYTRLPRGTANQLLAVNSGGTDIAWTTKTIPTVLGGISTKSGDGVTKIFNIAHGAGTTPTKYTVTAASTIAARLFTDGTAMAYWVTADSTNLIITYQVAPAAGSNNLSWAWVVFI